jgi:hypothetical protein
VYLVQAPDIAKVGFSGSGAKFSILGLHRFGATFNRTDQGLVYRRGRGDVLVIGFWTDMLLWVGRSIRPDPVTGADAPVYPENCGFTSESAKTAEDAELFRTLINKGTVRKIEFPFFGGANIASF